MTHKFIMKNLFFVLHFEPKCRMLNLGSEFPLGNKYSLSE